MGFQQLRVDIAAGADARTLGVTLDLWRTGVLLSQGGAAVALLDARADTLLADNRFNGSLSLYGEFIETRLNIDGLSSLGAALKAGRITMAPGPGALRLRNNRLRGVRYSEELTKRMLALIQTGGALDDCYRSIVAEANSLFGDTADYLAFDASLSTTVFDMHADVGVVIATQGKYLGNFAHDKFRLFALGHPPEKFGNGELNIVQL